MHTSVFSFSRDCPDFSALADKTLTGTELALELAHVVMSVDELPVDYHGVETLRGLLNDSDAALASGDLIVAENKLLRAILLELNIRLRLEDNATTGAACKLPAGSLRRKRLSAWDADRSSVQHIGRTAWADHPTAKASWIIDRVAELVRYRRGYGERTLRKWLKAVDPRPVESRRGRPSRRSTASLPK